MLARGPLAVVVAADNDPALMLPGAGRELRVEVGEHVLADLRDIGAQRQDLGARRHDVIGGDIVPGDQQHFTLDAVRQVLVDRTGLDVRPAHHLDLLARRCRRDDHPVIDDEPPGRRHIRRPAGVTGHIGQDTLEGAQGADLGAGQDHPRLLAAAAALEIPVERAQGERPGGGHLAHPDTGPAGGFENPRAAGDQLFKPPAVGDHFEDLTAAGGDREAQLGVRLFPL